MFSNYFYHSADDRRPMMMIGLILVVKMREECCGCIGIDIAETRTTHTMLGCTRSLQQEKWFLAAVVRKRPSDPNQRTNVSGARVPSPTNCGESIHACALASNSVGGMFAIAILFWIEIIPFSLFSTLIASFVRSLCLRRRCTTTSPLGPAMCNSRCCVVVAVVVCALYYLHYFYFAASCARTRMNAERKKERVFFEFSVSPSSLHHSLRSVCTQTFRRAQPVSCAMSSQCEWWTTTATANHKPNRIFHLGNQRCFCNRPVSTFIINYTHTYTETV